MLWSYPSTAQTSASFFGKHSDNPKTGCPFYPIPSTLFPAFLLRSPVSPNSLLWRLHTLPPLLSQQRFPKHLLSARLYATLRTFSHFSVTQLGQAQPTSYLGRQSLHPFHSPTQPRYLSPNRAGSFFQLLVYFSTLSPPF